MVNIAFKRAKTSPHLDGILHPEFITEYADTSKFPEGFHKVEDGFEILSEDLFNQELAKNEQLKLEFESKKQETNAFKLKLVEDKKRRDEARLKSKLRKNNE